MGRSEKVAIAIDIAIFVVYVRCMNNGVTEMAKIHLRANKLTGENKPISVCASHAMNGKLRANQRSTYRFMASEIVGFDDYKKVPSKDRCAHCDAAIPHFNRKRVAAGKREWDMSDAAR